MMNGRRNLRITAICVPVMALVILGIATSSKTTDYAPEIQAWPEYVDEYGNFAGVETSGPEFEVIEAAGPNALPDLMRALQDTTSVHHKGAARRK